MTDTAAHLASAWESFFILIGSSGAALIGIQFVVIALVADLRPRTSYEAIDAFGTPTIVHFAGALMISAIMCVPWPSMPYSATAVGLYGLGGLAYGLGVVGRARHQHDYAPVWEDWLWHAILPCAAYAALAVAGLLLVSRPAGAIFIVAAAAVALLLIAIHNAWDTVTHMVVTSSTGQEPNPD